MDVNVASQLGIWLLANLDCINWIGASLAQSTTEQTQFYTVGALFGQKFVFFSLFFFSFSHVPLLCVIARFVFASPV